MKKKLKSSALWKARRIVDGECVAEMPAPTRKSARLWCKEIYYKGGTFQIISPVGAAEIYTPFEHGEE